MTRNKRPVRSQADRERIGSLGVSLNHQVRRVAEALQYQGLSLRCVAPWDRAPKAHSSPTTAEIQNGLAFAVDLLENPPSDDERVSMMAKLPPIPL